MSVLENPRANPGLARIVFRQLAAVGGECHRDALFAAVSPPGAGWYDPAEKGSPQAETVTVGERLRLWTVSKGGILTLAVTTAEWGGGASTAQFRKLVRRQIFKQVADRNPFDEAGLTAFAGGVAWLLAQDPLLPFQAWEKSAKGRDGQTVQQADLGHTKRLVTNAIQWEAFAKWSVFLGFASQLHFSRHKDLLVPDPSVALLDVLADLGSTSDTASTALQGISSALPVLDGGSLRKHVEAQWRGESPPASVTPALSLALAQLEARGAIVLDNVPDARAKDRVVLHLGATPRTISTLTVGAAA